MKKQLQNRRVAIVYDRVNKWGGAERMLLALNEMFPEAPLYTSVYNPETAPWAKVFPKVIPSFLDRLPMANSNHEFLAPFMPLAFESFDLSDYDLVISVTSESAKGIITFPDTLHICYCLTPTRYLWSGYETYFNTSFKKTISKPIVNYLRNWDKVAAGRPDHLIAISSEVQSRIKEYYSLDSKIIFPPVSIFSNKSFKTHILNTTSYFLLVSRLVKYKRVDLAIKCFNQLNKKLVIVGKGRQERYLKSIASDNIVFINEVSEDKLFEFYKNAKALIVPQVEDFGLATAEAQSIGTPVIAYKKGGSLDIVENKKTGLFFECQTAESLAQAVDKFEKMQFDKKYIINRMKRFSKVRFQKDLLNYIKDKI